MCPVFGAECVRFHGHRVTKSDLGSQIKDHRGNSEVEATLLMVVFLALISSANASDGHEHAEQKRAKQNRSVPT